jgi:hypothetical protein
LCAKKDGTENDGGHRKLAELLERKVIKMEGGEVGDRHTEMPKKKRIRKKKVSFWTTAKVPKRVRVTFYARVKTAKTHKKRKKS